MRCKLFKPKLVLPLPIIHGNLKPLVTSQAGKKANGPNRGRPTHAGQDWMYRRVSVTEPIAGKPHKKFYVPVWAPALVVKAGTVRVKNYGKIKTGLRVWVEHADGMRTGYFHLQSLFVKPGQKVKAGQALGRVGYGLTDKAKLAHLHFELSPIDKYRPVDPRGYMSGAKAVRSPLLPHEQRSVRL